MVNRWLSPLALLAAAATAAAQDAARVGPSADGGHLVATGQLVRPTYPAHLAGSHGRGLKALRLRHAAKEQKKGDKTGKESQP